MLYRRFGRTHLQMPIFSCGGMRYQHRWQDIPLADIPQANQRNLEATIEQLQPINLIMLIFIGTTLSRDRV